ncbi:MAG: glycosyltransferase [Vicinamibacterales bacterium]
MPASRPRFSIVLPCLNEGAMLSMTAESIADHAGGVSCETIVVDDGSTDGSVDRLRARRMPGVRIVKGGRLGVARARNLGARHARGENLVFMDAHCRVSPGWLECFADVLEDPGVGMCGPSFTKLETPRPRGCGMYWADYTLDPCWFESPDRHDGYEAPLTTGACQVFRRDTFDALGRYDAGFTRWGFEDVEMCLRTWLLGYAIVVHPGVTVAHYFRESRDNYEVDDGEITYNFLRMIHLHFSPTRIRHVRDAVHGNPYVAAAQDRLADSDVFERRAALAARRRFDDAWFFAEVNGQPAA